MRGILLFFVFLVVCSCSTLSACSCIGSESVESKVKRLDLVALGTIVEVEQVSVIDSTFYEGMGNKAVDGALIEIKLNKFSLLVDHLFKGRITTDTIFIYTGIGGGDCGVRYTVGEQEIIYGVKNYAPGVEDGDFPVGKNIFYTDICLLPDNKQQLEIFEINKQVKKKRQLKEEPFMVNPQIAPKYKHGDSDEMMKHVYERLRYPNHQCIQGKVILSFIIDTDGQVKTIEVKRGLSKEANEEAIRVAKTLEFIPGTHYGEPVEVLMHLPISFSLQQE